MKTTARTRTIGWPAGRLLLLLPLALTLAASLAGCGGDGSTPTTATPAPATSTTPAPTTPSTPAPAAASAFNGNIVLGAPTSATVTLKLLSADQSGSVAIAYAPLAGGAELTTPTASLQVAQVLTLTLGSLAADTAYRYRVLFTPTGASGATPGAAYRFQTARAAGSSFSFTIQADSHLDENSSYDQYLRTLDNVLADQPDFHIDLGDTFMAEKHSDPLVALVQAAPDAATVNRRYRYERANFGRMSHSVPLFLANGNHEGELGWLDTTTANALPAWATQARLHHFANPMPGIFYRGDTAGDPIIGQRASWYAWQWGDALFIVLDPYWYATGQASRDGWNLTLGDKQYRWLADTLATTGARWKFVFVHSLVGGLDGQMRGGVEAAPYYEWGGRNADGSEGFATRRLGWPKPIHALLVQHGVTAVFHGHDHLYARQQLDGIVYQEVPQPSAANTASGPSLAQEYHYTSGTITSSSGHLRVTVGPSGVTSEYVRAWLPASETASRRNRQVDDRWTVTRP